MQRGVAPRLTHRAAERVPPRRRAAPMPMPSTAAQMSMPRAAAPMPMRRATLLAVALALAACSTPTRLPPDGPGSRIPPGLDRVPDAEPRVEALRIGGANKPYEVFGRRYTPSTGDVPWRESGLASWYGARFHGRPTALGEPYDMFAMSAAHKTLPLPSYARVRNPANGREVVVRVNDRGPFVDGRVIDLSYTAALKLGVLNGVAPVEVVRITFADIRSGRWRPPGAETPANPADPRDPADPLGTLLQQRGWAPPEP